MNIILEKIKLDIKWALASRGSIVMLSISFLLYDILYPILIYGIYESYKIPGWTLSQILFMYGVYMVVLGFDELIFNSFRWEAIDTIKNGRLDYWLARPKHILKIRGISLFLPSANDFFMGLILMFVFFQTGNILNLILLMIVAILFLEGFNILIVSAAIRYISVNKIWYVGENFLDASHWPIKVFPWWIKSFILIFPFVLVSYGPTYAYLFGNLNRFIVSIISAISIFIFSIIYLNHSLKKYSSAGG